MANKANIRNFTKCRNNANEMGAARWSASWIYSAILAHLSLENIDYAEAAGSWCRKTLNQ